jgi:hypothetical protein
MDETSQVPRKELSPRAQGLGLREVLPMQASTSWDDVAFSFSE